MWESTSGIARNSCATATRPRRCQCSAKSGIAKEGGPLTRSGPCGVVRMVATRCARLPNSGDPLRPATPRLRSPRPRLRSPLGTGLSGFAFDAHATPQREPANPYVGSAPSPLTHHRVFEVAHHPAAVNLDVDL